MPTQQEIDSVAHYLEAAIELVQSPFLDVDRIRIKFQRSQDPNKPEERASLSDEHVLKSFLMSFRRIYMQQEASHYFTVRNLLRKYSNDQRTQGFLDDLHATQSASEQQFHPAFAKPVPYTPKNIVDAFLNARYAHTGAQHSSKESARSQYEKIIALWGVAKASFYFHNIVFRFALTYTALGELAYSALLAWQKETELTPSFYVNVPEHLSLPWQAYRYEGVDRFTFDHSPSEENAVDRFQRYLRRRKFEHLRSLLEDIQVPVSDALLKLVDNGVTCRGFLANYLVDLELVTAASQEVADRYDERSMCMFDESTNLICAMGSSRDGRKVWMEGDAVRVIDNQFFMLSNLVRIGDPPRFPLNPPQTFTWKAAC